MFLLMRLIFDCDGHFQLWTLANCKFLFPFDSLCLSTYSVSFQLCLCLPFAMISLRVLYIYGCTSYSVQLYILFSPFPI